MDYVLTLCMVGLYSPLGMDTAMLISAFVRTVSCGYGRIRGGGVVVVELRKIGHSSNGL